MRTLRFLLEKEFRQVFRDKGILRIIFVMPVIQLLILPWAADYEVRNIRLVIVDHDHSAYSRQFVSKVTASGYFLLEDYTDSYKKASAAIEHDRADIIVQIPARFEKQLVRENESPMFLAVNAINGVKAVLGAAYLQRIIQDYNQSIRAEWMQLPRFSPETNIEVRASNWYNPLMNYKFFMVPGILVILVTMVGSFLASLNIVKEKELGTIEQINVTPVRKHHFILGKLIPFWVLGLIILTLGMLISRFAYGITPQGSLLTIYVFSAAYLLAVLGLGLLVSTFCSSQQQAMLISFFMMMIFILLGGLYTPIESMPVWAQWLTKANPVSYFIEVMRLVILKGSNLSDIAPQIATILVFASLLNALAVFNYKKRA
jgi:ABC-2 type transport system permease protein